MRLRIIDHEPRAGIVEDAVIRREPRHDGRRQVVSFQLLAVGILCKGRSAVQHFAAVPLELRGSMDAAEIYHQLLEHRWFLSEQKGEDVVIDKPKETVAPVTDLLAALKARWEKERGVLEGSVVSVMAPLCAPVAEGALRGAGARRWGPWGGRWWPMRSAPAASLRFVLLKSSKS